MIRMLVALVAVAALAGGPPAPSRSELPPNLALTVTNQSILVVDPSGRIVSTAVTCPGYQFAQFGSTGPTFSPDQHWILVDLLGPIEPGFVARRHAVVDVSTGRYVVSADFARYLGVGGSTSTLSWASGHRAAFRYDDGKVGVIDGSDVRTFPAARCASPAPG